MKTMSKFYTMLGYNRITTVIVRLRVKVTYHPREGTYTFYLFDGRSKCAKTYDDFHFSVIERSKSGSFDRLIAFGKGLRRN